MRGFAEKKLPGEKLVSVSVEYDDKIKRIEITGDFFVHPEAKLVDIEKALNGIPLSMNDMEIEQMINSVADSGSIKLIGISAKSIVAALRLATKSDF